MFRARTQHVADAVACIPAEPRLVRYGSLDSRWAGRRREETPAPARWNRWRRDESLTWGRPWRVGSVPDVLRDVALSVVDEPVLVADVGVPDDGVHPLVSGLHRRISWTPGVRSSRGNLGLGGVDGQPHTGDREAGRHQRPGDDPLSTVLRLHAVFSLVGHRSVRRRGGKYTSPQSLPHPDPMAVC